jgi:Amidase
MARCTGARFRRESWSNGAWQIDRLDQAGPQLNAVVTVNEAALDRASEPDSALQSGGSVGPLHGIPMVVKDCLETDDMPTSFGSEVFADYRPEHDAAVIAKLRRAGAVIVAKTTLPDWATSWFAYSSRSGETENPFALTAIREDQRRDGCRGVCRLRRDRAGNRLRRIGAGSGFILQPCRSSLHPGTDQPDRMQPTGGVSGHDRSDGQECGGRGAGL